MSTQSLSSLNISFVLFSIALFARFLFSFLETSITALRLFKLKELAQRSEKYSSFFKILETKPQQVLITILIANSLADVTSAALATHIMETIFAYFELSSNVGFFLGIFIAAIAILIFGEIIPKNIAKNKGDAFFGSTIWIAYLSFKFFYPIVRLLVIFSDGFTSLIGGSQINETSQWISSEKEIQFLIDYINEKGLMDTEKTEMLQNIFELGNTPAKEVLIPTNKIVSVSITTSIKDILKIYTKHQFTRLPVYKNESDNIIGMLHLKDVFALISQKKVTPIESLLHPILFIPETLKVNQILREFRQQNKHIAMVLNEHGTITGLITLEDVLEEIVGDINDEHDPEKNNITTLKNDLLQINADITLEDFKKTTKVNLTSKDSITLGGFLTEQLQHVPQKGDTVCYKGYCFKIERATRKRVITVLMFKQKNTLQ